MAGAGHKLWVAGDVVAASGGDSINTYIQDQVVGVYAASANRDAAFGGAGEPTLAEGMVCYLNDTNELQVYTGSAWVTIGDPAVLIVDSTNARVGINTDAPGSKLHVYDAASTVAGTQIRAEGRVGGYGAGISFASALTGGSVKEMAKITGDGEAAWDTTAANQDAGMRFFTCLNGTLAEAVRIQGDGDVGIGTGAPTAGLHLFTAGDGLDQLKISSTGGTVAEYGFLGASAASNVMRYGYWTGSGFGGHSFAGDVNIDGALSKGSGTFDIVHPVKGGDWRLRHSFIEGPRADLIYRGTVTLSGGTATVDLDDAAGMTTGTWEALCRDPWSMVASSGNAVEWSLSGKTLTMTSDTVDAVCSWIVMAERQDDHMKADSPIADDDGRLVVEYERESLVEELDAEIVRRREETAAAEAAAAEAAAAEDLP
jgi:hypothetical protein